MWIICSIFYQLDDEAEEVVETIQFSKRSISGTLFCPLKNWEIITSKLFESKRLGTELLGLAIWYSMKSQTSLMA